MLRDDVIEAVAAGKFHIYPIAHIDRGHQIMTGVPAGAPMPPATLSPTPCSGESTTACARWPTR